MKRILCLIDSLGPGGAQRQIVGLARFLKKKGYDVIVAAYHDDRFYVDQLLSAGVPYVYLRKVQKGLFRLWHLIQFIRKVKPDVVISYLESPSIRSCVAHIFIHRFKLIVSERNTTQHTGKLEILRFNLFRVAEYVVPNAFAQAEYIKKNFPFLSNNVVTIPNFVDLHHFMPTANYIRRHVPEIIIVATIWESKNTLGFIDAVFELKKRGCEFHVSWYGKVKTSIEYFNICQEKIKKMEVGNFIDLKEKTKKIIDKYQEADYFCLPSFYEGTPNVICEAMACGLPILCSDVCDNSRYVIDGVNGFLFNPNNIDSIVRAFERMFAISDEHYNNFRMQSRLRAESLLSENKFVESYIDLIEK